MYAALEKWQSTALVLAIIIGTTALALLEHVDGDTVAQGLFGLGSLVLGAGAVAHGVRQGARSSNAGAELELELEREKRTQ